MLKVVVDSEKDLPKVVENLNLQKGDVVFLKGDLGTGKTTLTKEIGKKLEIKETINSPTFTILNEYKSGEIPLYHFDLYRINSLDELENSFNIFEYFNKDGIVIVEWPEIIEGIAPKNTKLVEIKYISENKREFNISTPVAN